MANPNEVPGPKGWAEVGEEGYLAASRGWAAALIFLLPLLLLYEVGVAAVVARRTGAEVLFKGPLAVFTGRQVVVFNVILIVVVVAAIGYLARRRDLRPYFFPFMLIEGVAYGLALERLMAFLMPVVRRIIETTRPPTALLLAAPPANSHHVLEAVVSAAGAGVYEEVLFRGILITALFFVLHDLFRAPAAPAGVVSILGSAALFSMMHFLGPAGEPFAADKFAHRLIAGLILSGIFLTRGLGIAAYAHAVHNVVVALQHPLSGA